MLSSFRVAVATALLAAAVAAPAAGAAAPRGGTVVLTGSRSASAVLTLSRQTTLDVQRWTATPPVPGTASVTAPYRGFYVQSLSGGPSGGSLAPQAYRYGPLAGWRIPLAWNARPGDDADLRLVLPRGRYRVTLLTDGPTRVTIPAAGLGRRVDLRPAAPAVSRATLHELVPGRVPGGTPRAGLGVQQVALTRRTLTVVAVHVLSHSDADVVSAGSYDACVTPAVPDPECGHRAAMHSNRQTRVTSGTAGNKTVVADDLALVYPPGVYAPGDYQARMTAASTQLVDQALGFVLTLAT